MTEQPVVFITGASQGIGAATAKAFARQGYHTLLLARNARNLEAVADEVRRLGSQALVCAGDLGDLDFAKQSVDRCLDQWGRIDVLVNNATWRELTTMRQIGLESWEKTLRVGLTAPAFLAQWCAVPMEAAGRGVILNISSIQSQFAPGVAPAYVASKGGLDALTYELSTLYGPVGIRVLSLNLGAVDTAGSADYRSDDGQDITAELRAASEDMIPLGRWAQPEEIARSIVMFAGDEASYLTGESILIDGGWRHQCLPYSWKRRQFPREFPAASQDRSP